MLWCEAKAQQSGVVLWQIFCNIYSPRIERSRWDESKKNNNKKITDALI